MIDLLLMSFGITPHSFTVHNIKRYEGFRSCGYEDAGGYSKGYGQWASGPNDCISEELASLVVEEEVRRLDKLLSLKHPTLTAWQRGPLILLTYNTPVTQPALKVKTNDLMYLFPKYMYYQGKKNAVLEHRRNFEQYVYQIASYFVINEQMCVKRNESFSERFLNS